MKNKLIWRGEILWEKNNYNCKYTAWGSWKSPSNPYMKYTWEFLEIFCKGDLKHLGDRSKADIDVAFIDAFKIGNRCYGNPFCAESDILGKKKLGRLGIEKIVFCLFNNISGIDEKQKIPIAFFIKIKNQPRHNQRFAAACGHIEKKM